MNYLEVKLDRLISTQVLNYRIFQVLHKYHLVRCKKNLSDAFVQLHKHKM